jgi:Capsule assembly protein Wzi
LIIAQSLFEHSRGKNDRRALRAQWRRSETDSGNEEQVTKRGHVAGNLSQITRRGQRLGLCFWLLLLSAQAQAQAQNLGASRSWSEATVGSEFERYLRALQVAGVAPAGRAGWRGPEDRGVPADTAHPWRALIKTDGDRPALLRPGAGLTYNSGWPSGVNDGPVWAGKGATLSASAGGEAHWGGLMLRVEPQWFMAQNAGFKLEPVPAGYPAWRDPVSPGSIDAPQRMGDGTYSRVDAGQSTLAFAAKYLSFGVSSANEGWGPSLDSPIILGANAPGIPRLFFSTGRSGVPLWIGHGHLRVIYGRMTPSGFGPQGDTSRFMSGVIAAFTPRGLDGVEMGITRVFHRWWPQGGLTGADFRVPFEGFFKKELKNKDNAATAGGTPDNQLASVFVRVMMPRVGAEAYVEYGLEDHSWNPAQFLAEPDHISATMLGVRRVVLAADGRTMRVWRAEWINGRITHLARTRGEGLFYEHGQIVDGHTYQGQILGTPAVRGGGLMILSRDSYTTHGRWTASVRREGRQDSVEGGVGRGALVAATSEWVRFVRGNDLFAKTELQAMVSPDGSGDKAQLVVQLGARYGW